MRKAGTDDGFGHGVPGVGDESIAKSEGDPGVELGWIRSARHDDAVVVCLRRLSGDDLHRLSVISSGVKSGVDGLDSRSGEFK